MDIRTTTSTPAAADCDPARIFVAIELSKKSWMAAVLTPLADKISLHTLPAGDGEALLMLLGQTRRRVAAALSRPVEIVSCYEAGYDGFWLHRLLVAHSVKNRVFDPASLQVSRRARRAKTDRIDVHGLLRALMAHLRGEPKVVSVVRVPSAEDEDARRPHRERDRLIRERVQHVNRIKGLCAAQGIYGYEPLKRDRRARLAALCTGDGRTLPPRLAAEIGRELTRLEVVLDMIADLEAVRDAVIRERTPTHPHAEKIGRLTKLKAIGPEFATVLSGEVFYRSFANRRYLETGLVPDGARLKA
jgi:transposase